MGDERLDMLLFELSSATRRDILQLLLKEDLKMSEIARSLELTGTESFRQMQRLGDAGLVQRMPEGAFQLTQYGRLALYLGSAYRFISSHFKYFTSHDVWRLPPVFINRIGELSGAALSMDTIDNINRGAQMFFDAEEYADSVVEHEKGPDFVSPKMTEQLKKGLRFRVILREDIFAHSSTAKPEPGVELRGIAEVPFILAVTEKEAFIGFRHFDGRVDYTGFFGDDPFFHRSADDLFKYLWEKGKR